MRQAGRSLPEYRAVRGEGSILDAIKQPDLAAEITLQPVRRYGVDAAVLYSDIVVPAHAVGFGIDVAPGTGPVADRAAAPPRRPRPAAPARARRHRLRRRRPSSASPPSSAPTCRCWPSPAPRSPSPATSIEGRPSRTYEHTKALMHTDEALWHDVMDRLADDGRRRSSTSSSRTAPRRSSCSTRGPGRCRAADYERYVLPHSRRVFAELADAPPRRARASTSASAATTCSRRCASAGPRVIGPRLAHADRRRPARRLGADVVVQGNLDPALVLAGADVALAGARARARRQRRPPRPRLQPRPRRAPDIRPRRARRRSSTSSTPRRPDEPRVDDRRRRR